ncbi:MAG: MBL fold metallo-hydrolase [Kibdelosporangium sp.]
MLVEPGLHEIVSGVHAWIQPDGAWWLNNAGAVHGDDGLILVDTCATRRRTELFLGAVHTASDGAEIRLAVNTHLHGDHVYGNALLPASTTIVSHEKTRDGILADFLLTTPTPIWQPAPDWGIDAIRAPTLTFRDGITLHTGQRAVEVKHPGYVAHTVGDAIAWLPAERVLFTGDLVFNQVTPLVFMGSVDGALRSVEWLRQFPADHVVPGHGPLITGEEFPAVLTTLERYYRFILDTAEAGAARGLTPLEAAHAADLGEFAGLPDDERIVLNLHRAYADAAGEEMNLLAALTDAMTYHGGPLGCAL